MMKLLTLKQFEKKSRSSLMRFIIGYLKTRSKRQVAIFAYTLAKSKLPRLEIKEKKLRSIDRWMKERQRTEIKRLKALGYKERLPRRKPIRRTKRKFSRKQLAAQRLFAKRARAGTLKRRRR